MELIKNVWDSQLKPALKEISSKPSFRRGSSQLNLFH